MLTVVNFAHGAFFMVGAFIGLYFLGLTGNFWFSLVLTPLAVGAIGLVTERFLVRPLYGRGIDYPLLLTFGLGWVLIEAMRVLFGIEGLPSIDAGRAARRGRPGHRLLPEVPAVPDLRHGGDRAGAVAVPREDALRADRPRRLARRRDLQGARASTSRASGWWCSASAPAIAGLCGVLAAPTRAVNPEMGIHVLAESFVVTVVGGMGSLPGAVVAGLLVGVVFAMTSLFAPDLAELSIFVLMAVVLLVRPQGLFGKAGLMG